MKAKVEDKGQGLKVHGWPTEVTAMGGLETRTSPRRGAAGGWDIGTLRQVSYFGDIWEFLGWLEGCRSILLRLYTPLNATSFHEFS